MIGDNVQAIDSWSAYWRTGSGASCFVGSETEVHLTQVWNGFVDELADGARLLDLATGNGTVVRSCAARARVRNIRLHIEAVDAAEIDPPRHVADPEQFFRDIHFRGGIRLEALPFPDGTFDGVVSQFGFEYANEEQAAAEAVRVLAPGGRLRPIIHARDGAVSRDISTRLERLHSVLAENGPVSLVLALARAAEAGDVATLSRKSSHLAAAVELSRRLADRPPPDDAALFYSREFLQLWAGRERYLPSGLRRSVEEGWANASGVAIRQEQLLRALPMTWQGSALALPQLIWSSTPREKFTTVEAFRSPGCWIHASLKREVPTADYQRRYMNDVSALLPSSASMP